MSHLWPDPPKNRVLPTEDTRPPLTPAQHETLKFMRAAYDAVDVDRVLPDGTAWVVTHRDAETAHHNVAPDGLVF